MSQSDDLFRHLTEALRQESLEEAPIEREGTIEPEALEEPPNHREAQYCGNCCYWGGFGRADENMAYCWKYTPKRLGVVVTCYTWVCDAWEEEL